MTATLDTSELIAALLAEANRHANETADLMNSAAEALAATLRQQAGRVDEGMSLHDRLEFALRDAGFDYDEAFRIAALAQNTQGEAAIKTLTGMGWAWDGNWWIAPPPCHRLIHTRDMTLEQARARIRDFVGSARCEDLSEYEVDLRAWSVIDAHLYLHAERARVPEYSAEIEDAMVSVWNNGPQAVYFAIRDLLAAAPSQSKDAGSGLSADVVFARLGRVSLDVDCSYFGPHMVGEGDKVELFVVSKAKRRTTQPEDAE